MRRKNISSKIVVLIISRMRSQERKIRGLKRKKEKTSRKCLGVLCSAIYSRKNHQILAAHLASKNSYGSLLII
jgi:hypothetical protein